MIQRLKKSMGYLIALTIIGQTISFVRESIFAYYYGTSYRADAYVMASQIPIALFAVVTTSINTVILPIYTSKREKLNKRGADEFLNSFIVVFELLCLALVIVSCVLARQIVFVFAPAFSGELLDLTVRYARMLFPTIILTSIINILTVRYNVEKNFSYPQYVGLLQNISIIVLMIFFAPHISTDAAVIGTILGLGLNAAFLAIPCKTVFSSKVQINSLWPDIQHVLSKVIPVACGIGIAEINRIVDKAIASGLDTGSITGLNYANKLTVVFSALIVTALSTVCFQKFSALYAQGKQEERFVELCKYLLVIVYILLPVTSGVILLKRELIEVAFGRGAFGVESVKLTSNIFYYYAIGIVPIAMREILSKYYYAEGDTKTPVINAAIGVALNIALNLILSKVMAAAGLALATSISYFAVCVMLLFRIVSRNTFNKQKYNYIINFIPSFVATLIMSGMVYYVINLKYFESSLITLLIGFLVGLFSYFVICCIIARKQLGIIASVLFGKV